MKGGCPSLPMVAMGHRGWQHDLHGFTVFVEERWVPPLSCKENVRLRFPFLLLDEFLNGDCESVVDVLAMVVQRPSCLFVLRRVRILILGKFLRLHVLGEFLRLVTRQTWLITC